MLPARLLPLLLSCALLLLLNIKVQAQQLEVFGGYFPNDYYSKEGDSPFYQAEHSDGDGFSIGITIDSIFYDSRRLRFTLSYEQYTGGLTEADGGHGGGYGLKMQTTKSTIGFRFYLVNVNIVDELCFNFGGAFNFLVAEETEGSKESYYYGQNGGSSSTVDMSNSSINAPWTFGIIGRLGYYIKLRNQLYLVPNYTMYLGLVPEFKDVTTKSKSFRQYFELGLARRF